MSDTAIAVHATPRTQFAKIVDYAMWTIVCVHALALVVGGPNPIATSRYLTAAIPILAAIACIWRARLLPTRERPVWLWSSAGLLLWATAHIIETVFGHSTAASSLTIDASDFIYLA